MDLQSASYKSPETADCWNRSTCGWDLPMYQLSRYWNPVKRNTGVVHGGHLGVARKQRMSKPVWPSCLYHSYTSCCIYIRVYMYVCIYTVCVSVYIYRNKLSSIRARLLTNCYLQLTVGWKSKHSPGVSADRTLSVFCSVLFPASWFFVWRIFFSFIRSIVRDQRTGSEK